MTKLKSLPELQAFVIRELKVGRGVELPMNTIVKLCPDHGDIPELVRWCGLNGVNIYRDGKAANVVYFRRLRRNKNKGAILW